MAYEFMLSVFFLFDQLFLYWTEKVQKSVFFMEFHAGFTQLRLKKTTIFRP